MTISSSLAAGVAGLFANATQLATISDNIANSATFGYKRVNTDFSSFVTNSSRGSGTYSAGGVGALTSRLVDEHGPLISTSNSTDLAVKGRGMLPVTTSASLAGGGEPELLMTPTGSFRSDENGVLRSESGLVLLGWPANRDGTIPVLPRDSASGLVPVVIDRSQTTADPTTRATLGVNLPASATRSGAGGETLDLRIEYYDNLGAAQHLDVAFTPTVPATGSSNAWTLRITDGAQGNALIGEYTIAFDASRGNGGALDSVTTISGGAYDPTDGTLALTVAGGPLRMDIGRPGTADGLTQVSGPFAPTGVTRDGSPIGNLTGVEVDENGFVLATYDTGFVRTIYQVPLVDVPNMNGLTALSDQTYRISGDSGAFFLWDAGTGPTGALAGYSREGSSTDVAAELTQLIQTQRAYSSNAKVIQTVDEMLQETTNLKR